MSGDADSTTDIPIILTPEHDALCMCIECISTPKDPEEPDDAPATRETESDTTRSYSRLRRRERTRRHEDERSGLELGGEG